MLVWKILMVISGKEVDVKMSRSAQLKAKLMI